MQGHLKKRATWEYVADLGEQPLQRCPACHKRYWLSRERLASCPRCRGPLEETVKRRQEMKAGFQTKREAQEALTQVLAALAGGTHIEPTRVLLSEFLQAEWLPAIRPTIRPTTFLSYAGHVERHIAPDLGTLPLQQLTGAHLNAFYACLLRADPGEGKRPLSSSTVRRIHATLHRALGDAMRWNRILRNPADAADPPRAAAGAEHEMQVWSIQELRVFLTAERGSDLYPLWLTLATTGMRRGEVLGLRWEDVDLEAQTLSIRQTRVMYGYQPLLSTPKTRRGKRLVALDPATAAALHEQRRRQKETRRASGAGPGTGFVFTRADGEPHHPERVSQLFRQAARRAGLPRIRLHDLRHTYATLALGAGVHPKIVSERLGHANIGITLDTYSHCLPALSAEAACRVAALVLAD